MKNNSFIKANTPTNPISTSRKRPAGCRDYPDASLSAEVTDAIHYANHDSTSLQQDQLNLFDHEAPETTLDPAWNFEASDTPSQFATPFVVHDNTGAQGAATNSPIPGSNATIVLVETQRSSATKRRRESNRASQRAFRERKEKHRQYLEYQLQALQAQHQDLLDLSTLQADNINQLRSQIAALTAELNCAQFYGVYPTNGTINSDGVGGNNEFDVSSLRQQFSFDPMDLTGDGTNLPQF